MSAGRLGATRVDRITAIDAARGLAIVGMVVFHLAWDLHDFGWTGLDPSRSPGWVLFGHAVASCFLFLSGFGLILAKRQGVGLGRALRRITLVAGAALSVTLVTAVVTPGETVWFGILHCIALSNLLALPLLGAPAAAVLVSAAAAMIVPHVAAGRAPAGLWWLGVSDQIPATLDVRPLLPWLGVVLLGVAFGRLHGAEWIRRLAVGSRPAPMPLATAGRHSLAIYLAHQPLLFGLFSLLAATRLAPVRAADPAGAFAAQCQAACVITMPADQCSLFCSCARRRLERKLPASVPAETIIGEAAQACRTGDSQPLALHGS